MLSPSDEPSRDRLEPLADRAGDCLPDGACPRANIRDERFRSQIDPADQDDHGDAYRNREQPGRPDQPYHRPSDSLSAEQIEDHDPEHSRDDDCLAGAHRPNDVDESQWGHSSPPPNSVGDELERRRFSCTVGLDALVGDK